MMHSLGVMEGTVADSATCRRPVEAPKARYLVIWLTCEWQRIASFTSY
jgi:hypothetical protein